MKRILKEPLFHFLLLGAGLFVAYGLISRPGSNSAPGKIVVTVGHVEHLAAGFAKTWQRPPSDAELKGLVDDWVREEIATREAIAMGMDKDDTIIRRPNAPRPFKTAPTLRLSGMRRGSEEI